MARKLCVEMDELRDRTDYLERILDKYNMFRMDGRASFRGATWELSELHIAQWTAASSLPLDDADSYARFINGGLEIRGGQVDIHTGEGNERIEIDGSGIRGYAGGVEKFKLDAATGLITATGGTVGGWTLSATSLVGGNATLHNSGYMLLGTGNDIARMDAADATWRLWIGHATNTSAPFRVDKNGNLVATSATITGSMQSSNYVSNVSGWKIDSAGRAEFQDIIARGELHCAVFVKDLIDARAGTMIIAKSAGMLSNDVAVPAAGTWLIYVNDPPGGAAFLFENADECQMNTEYVTGVRNVWFTVSARNDMGDGRQRYTCTYTAGTRNVTYYAGTPIIDYGVANQGLLRMTAEAALNGPYYEILTTAGAPWTPDFTVRGRFGNLNGIAGLVADTYGLFVGDYAGGNYLLYEPAGGFVVKAGGGVVSIGGGGVTFGEGTAAANMITWLDGANALGQIYAHVFGGTDAYTELIAIEKGGNASRVRLIAIDSLGAPTDYTQLVVTSDAGVEINAVGTSPADLKVDGQFGVGIAPAVLFHVDSAAGIFRLGNTAAAGLEYQFGAGDLYLGGDNTQAGNLYIKDAAGAIKISLNSDAASVFATAISYLNVGTATGAVTGDIHTAGDNALIQIKNTKAGVAGLSYLEFRDDAAAVNLQIGTANDTKAFFANKQNGDMGFETNAVETMTLSAAGALRITGCLTQDGSCEIFTEDALGIIADILSHGSGIVNEYGHEKFDMKWGYATYPSIFVKSIIKEYNGRPTRISYGERTAAKSDLLYRAVMQLETRIAELEMMLSV